MIPGLGRSIGEGIGFPGGSAGKESAYDVGDLGLILGWEDPLEEVMATHPHVLAWRTPWTTCSPCGRNESDTTE